MGDPVVLEYPYGILKAPGAVVKHMVVGKAHDVHPALHKDLYEPGVHPEDELLFPWLVMFCYRVFAVEHEDVRLLYERLEPAERPPVILKRIGHELQVAPVQGHVPPKEQDHRFFGQ
jgi:hypothetical protein